MMFRNGSVEGEAGFECSHSWLGAGLAFKNQRDSVDAAFLINALNGAHASFEEEIKGSITTGKLSDFVVLSEDLHTVDPEKIKDVQVVRTVVGRTTVYQA